MRARSDAGRIAAEGGSKIEMAEGSGLSARINYKDVPLMEGLDQYISQMIFPDSIYRNWNSYQHKVTGVTGPSFITLCDPQTSGGLLVAVDPGTAGIFLSIARKAGAEVSSVPFGLMTDKKEKAVEVVE